MIQEIIPSNKIVHPSRINSNRLDTKSYSKIVEPINYLAQLGKITNGHTNDKIPYPETTIIDLLHPLEDKGRYVREYTSSHIKGTLGLVGEICDIVIGKKERRNSLIGSKNENYSNMLNLPTLDVPFELNNFRDAVIYDEESFLKGAYIFTQVDKYENRERVSRLYRDINGRKINIGGGNCHVANYDALRELDGLKVSKLSSEGIGEDLEELLYKRGILSKFNSLESDYRRDIDNQFCLYIKRKNELGCCDDAMLSTVGRLFLNKGPRAAYSAMMGAALIDTVDTLDKISAMPVTGGADELIGDFINEKYSSAMCKPLVKQELVDLVIYAGAKNNNGYLPFSSSVNKLNKFQNGNRLKKPTTPIKAHIDFVLTGKDTQGLGLGFKQFSSSRFYHIMENIRWKNMENLGLLKPL